MTRERQREYEIERPSAEQMNSSEPQSNLYIHSFSTLPFAALLCFRFMRSCLFALSHGGFYIYVENIRIHMHSRQLHFHKSVLRQPRQPERIDILYAAKRYSRRRVVFRIRLYINAHTHPNSRTRASVDGMLFILRRFHTLIGNARTYTHANMVMLLVVVAIAISLSK